MNFMKCAFFVAIWEETPKTIGLELFHEWDEQTVSLNLFFFFFFFKFCCVGEGFDPGATPALHVISTRRCATATFLESTLNTD